MWTDYLPLIIFASLLLLGFIAGKWTESRHYENLQTREQAFLTQPAITSKTLDPAQTVEHTALAMGAVVVSVDHFKRFLATLRMLVGGELGSYASVLDRGKREALLRMKESCPAADIYVNCRLETAAISRGRKSSIGCVEIVAYSTAVHFTKNA